MITRVAAMLPPRPLDTPDVRRFLEVRALMRPGVTAVYWRGSFLFAKAIDFLEGTRSEVTASWNDGDATCP